MHALSLHSDGSLVSSSFFRSHNEIGEAESFLEGISSLVLDGESDGSRR